LSATAKVAENREVKKYLSDILSSVLQIKALLAVVVSAIFLAFVFLNGSMRGDWLFYATYLASYSFNGFMPDFFYRGMENMKMITYRTVSVKVFFTIMVFIFVRDRSQYVLIPMFMLAGNLVTVILMHRDIANRYDVKLCRPHVTTVRLHFKDSLQFFASRIASTAYQAANAIILNAIYGNAPEVGFYTSADKLVNLSKSMSSPVADSLYPYMVKHRDFKVVKKLLLVAEPMILLGCVVAWLYADPICRLIFGAEFIDTGRALRLLLPIIAVIFPTYVLAFPVMVPLGLTKYANLSNVIGLVIQVILIASLLALGRLNMYSLCISASLTEVSVFFFRLIVVLRKIRRMRMK
jgi:PST family polysaccharide transporter